MAPRPRLVKISRARGQLLAEVEGRWLAVLQERHWNFHSHAYRAPLAPEARATPEIAAYLAALQNEPLAVMERDLPLSGAALPDQIHIGVFRFGGLILGDDHFSLTLLERYASPRP